MKRIKRFFINAIILGATTILMRSISVVFSAYLSDKIGAEGLGLFSLISSVYMFAVTLAASGIHLAVTRLVSEELERENGAGVIQAMRHCVAYALAFGGLSFLLLFFGANFISTHILQDARTYLSLRVLSVALPFIALSNVFSGYFNATRRVYKSASSGIAEQCVKIAITVAMIGLLAPRGMEYACLALVIGTAASEALSFFYLIIFYIIDKKHHINAQRGKKSTAMRSRMLNIALPIALSSYLRSGLVTVQHILIPIGLRRHGSDTQSALASYGTIHGMVFPLILFPSAVCSTFAGLIIPEMSELAVKYGRIYGNRHICYIVRRALTAALLFSIGVAGVFICFAKPLGYLVYGSEEAGKYIGIFASLIPVMYLDTTVDGMLKGLGQQMRSMLYNIIDASMSVLLVWTLMPQIGIYGYVICVFVTELVNLALSINRLLAVTGATLPLCRTVFLPVLCIIGATSLASILLRLLFPSVGLLFLAATGITAATLFYLVLLRTTGSLSGEDVLWLRSLGKSA